MWDFTVASGGVLTSIHSASTRTSPGTREASRSSSTPRYVGPVWFTIELTNTQDGNYDLVGLNWPVFFVRYASMS